MKDDSKTKKQLVHELSELRSQNVALEKSESAEKYRSLVENIRDVIYELDSQGVVLYISPAIRDLLGYDSAEIVGKNFIELAHKDDQNSLSEWFSELRKGREDPSEYRILNKSGELRWARTKTRPIMEDGLFKGAHGILIDVTDQRRMEEALRMLAVRNEAILAAVPDIIMEVDVCKRYTWANQAGMRFFGEDVIGREASYYFEGEQETYNKVQPLFNGGEDVIYIESWQRRQDGEKRLLSWWCKVLKNEQGLVIGALSTGRDITERKQAEEELRESEEKYRNILENIEDGYFEVDLAGNFTFFNDSVCRMVGYTHAELMGMNNRQYTDKENSRILYQAFSKVFSTGEPSKGVDHEIIGKDGTKLYIESSISLIRNTSGQPIGFRGIMRNITERKRAEEANRNAEAHYHALFEQSPKGILLIDPETGKTIEANETAYKQLGYTREEFGALRISDYETLEKPEETAKHIQKVIHDGIDDFETRHRTKSGEIRNVHVWAKKVQLSNRSFIYTLFQDITDRKQAEEALQEGQRQLKAILDNIPDIAWLKDKESSFIAVNEPFGKSCGFKPGDLVGKTDFDIWPRDLAERYRADDNEVMESGKRKQVEEPLTDGEGKSLWIETIKTPIYDAHGNVIGTAGIARDITERKRTEEELKR
ncbi:MAG: PAS domain S-box protein, partial [Deltaproteobacteria bacterium]|nr:PAS domain S-box protein [Deltaproteobacteria bacterium]